MAKNLKTSALGIAVYPHVHAPDTKFDAAGVYTTKLKLEGNDADALKAEIDAAITASVAQAKKDNPKKTIKQADAPYQSEKDNDGNDTGATLFNFKLKASGKRKDGEVFTQQPAVFDAKGKAIKGKRIGGGSEIRVAYEISPFYTAQVGAGVTMRLKAVQVIELREYSGDASSFGFGEVEGGYSSEGEVEDVTPFSEPAAPAPTSNAPQSASDF